MKSSDIIWKLNTPKQLAIVLADVADENNMQRLLSDLLTEKEIIEISSRLEAAWLLANGEKYTDIIKKTKLSSRTVARISDWLKNGNEGYKFVLPIITRHHKHLPPARSE